jgi:hypothetical protein
MTKVKLDNILISAVTAIKPNGTAVAGVNVTGAAIRLIVPIL